MQKSVFIPKHPQNAFFGTSLLCSLALPAPSSPRHCFPYAAGRCSLGASRICLGEKFSFQERVLKSHSILIYLLIPCETQGQGDGSAKRGAQNGMEMLGMSARGAAENLLS